MENILNEKDLNQAEMEETTADEMLRTEELENMALDDAVDQEDPETAPVEGQIDKEEEILNHGEGNHSGRTMGRRQTKARRLLEQMSQPEPQIKHSVLAGRTERVETGLDNNDIQVSNARRENRIIEGTIESVRLRGNGRIVLSISDYCGYRVVIDEENMGVTIRRKEDETDMQYRRKMMRVFESMIGAKIFYVIQYYENKIIIGNRKRANEIRSGAAFRHKNSAGEYVLSVGSKVPATVLSVFRFFAYIDVFGLPYSITRHSFRASYVSAISDYLSVGQEIEVYITELERDENGNLLKLGVTMRNDEKELEEQTRLAKGIVEGMEYLAVITSRTSKAFFLQLKTNGMLCYAYLSGGVRCREIPEVGDQVVVRIVEEQVNRRTGMPTFQVNIFRRVGRGN